MGVKICGSRRVKAKTWYDRRTVTRTFSPGDKVLVLLFILNKPLHAKYHGPYKIIEQLGPVDYVVSNFGRRKTKGVCHINLLKPYHKREPRLNPQLTEIEPKVRWLVCLTLLRINHHRK